MGAGFLSKKCNGVSKIKLSNVISRQKNEKKVDMRVASFFYFLFNLVLIHQFLVHKVEKMTKTGMASVFPVDDFFFAYFHPKTSEKNCQWEKNDRREKKSQKNCQRGVSLLYRVFLSLFSSFLTKKMPWKPRKIKRNPDHTHIDVILSFFSQNHPWLVDFLSPFFGSKTNCSHFA